MITAKLQPITRIRVDFANMFVIKSNYPIMGNEYLNLFLTAIHTIDVVCFHTFKVNEIAMSKG